MSTYLRLPELAKKNPKQMFLGKQDGGRFEDIFCADMTAERFLAAQRLAWAVGNHIKAFASLKRKKEDLRNWQDAYANLLGQEIVEAYGPEVDEMVPQSAMFLTALVYTKEVRLGGRDIDEVTSELEAGNTAQLNGMLEKVMRFRKDDERWNRSWPTLLKSQLFFEGFVDEVLAHQ